MPSRDFLKIKFFSLETCGGTKKFGFKNFLFYNIKNFLTRGEIFVAGQTDRK